MKLEGIHHVTAITGDAPRNVDFYARVLGLRLVKKTVNQDDPSVYHLFYADEQGSAGADLTFFEYPGAQRGRAGAGMVHRVVFRVGGEDALDFWEERLRGEDVPVERSPGSLLLADPEGLALELRVVDTPDAPLDGRPPRGPGRGAPAGLRQRPRLRARPGAQPRAARAGAGVRADRRRRVGGARARARRDVRHRRRRAPPASPAPAPCTTSRGPRRWTSTTPGSAGSTDAGLHPTPVIDRFYFRSIYFREPGGVLFEIATHRPRLRDRRGPGAPRRARRPAAGVRAPARAHRADPDAAAQPAGDADGVAALGRYVRPPRLAQ